MFNALRHNLVNSGTTLVTEFCGLFDMQALFGSQANCVAAPSDTGWLNFNGAGSFSSVGSDNVWANPGNALLSDVAVAQSITIVGLDTQELQAVNLGGGIVPGGATIVGIQVRNERFTTGVGGDLKIQLIQSGVPAGDDKAIVGAWPNGLGNKAYAEYGGAADLWGLTITAADVNGATFGFLVQATGAAFEALSVDHMQMRIFFS